MIVVTLRIYFTSDTSFTSGEDYTLITFSSGNENIPLDATD